MSHPPLRALGCVYVAALGPPTASSRENRLAMKPVRNARYVVLTILLWYAEDWCGNANSFRLGNKGFFEMPASSTTTPCDIWPWAPHRCPRCCRLDTIPMPAEFVLDKLIGCFRYSPFKCRACRAKFYRRSNAVPKYSAPAAASAPVPSVGVCHRDAANTLQRVQHIIQVAESQRLRRG